MVKPNLCYCQLYGFFNFTITLFQSNTNFKFSTKFSQDLTCNFPLKPYFFSHLLQKAVLPVDRISIISSPCMSDLHSKLPRTQCCYTSSRPRVCEDHKTKFVLTVHCQQKHKAKLTPRGHFLRCSFHIKKKRYTHSQNTHSKKQFSHRHTAPHTHTHTHSHTRITSG